MEKQRGMAFGFWKTATAVIKPDGWMDFQSEEYEVMKLKKKGGGGEGGGGGEEEEEEEQQQQQQGGKKKKKQKKTWEGAV